MLFLLSIASDGSSSTKARAAPRSPTRLKTQRATGPCVKNPKEAAALQRLPFLVAIHRSGEKPAIQRRPL